jgi:hypothetical protein
MGKSLLEDYLLPAMVRYLLYRSLILLFIEEESTCAFSAFLPYEPKLFFISSMFFFISAAFSFLLLMSFVCSYSLIYLGITLLPDAAGVSSF